MVRGDVVKPSAVALERTQFRESSRLTVAVRRSAWPGECRSCGGVLLVGELYARGKEHLSGLCLECVMPVEEPAS